MASQKELIATACRALEADLVLYHYRDLAGGEREKVEHHIASCAGCARYLNELAVLLPLSARNDEPGQEFWLDYNRELRQKLDTAAQPRSWWLSLARVIHPRYLAGVAAAFILVLAVTVGKGIWSPKPAIQDEELIEGLPVTENLEFFRTMDVLDNLELLEFMAKQSDSAT